MESSPNLCVSLANLGPIVSGEFELKPLTLFIGPNNSGKTYAATLTYVLHRVLFQLGWHFADVFDLEAYESWAQKERVRRRFAKWLEGAYVGQQQRRAKTRVKDAPNPFKTSFLQAWTDNRPLLEKTLSAHLHDYFRCDDIRELVRAQLSEEPLVLQLRPSGSDSPFLQASLSASSAKPAITASFLGSNRVANMPLFDTLAQASDKYRQPWRSAILTEHLWQAFWEGFLALNGVSSRSAYYLPAARSGIQMGLEVFASAAIKLVRRRIGLQRIEIDPFSGVAGDFMQVMLDRGLRKGWHAGGLPKAHRVLDVLEGQVFKGSVVVHEEQAEIPALFYRPHNIDQALPLGRASSMVAELAPLDILVKRILTPGDLLIIDEPEAHLHPESQRSMARVLVRLVRAGVRVVCTTHSSLILHQLSNHLLATAAPPHKRRRLRFMVNDLLQPAELGVHLFRPSDEGTHIETLHLQPGFGVPEDEFVRVSDAIGEETLRVTLAAR